MNHAEIAIFESAIIKGTRIKVGRCEIAVLKMASFKCFVRKKYFLIFLILKKLVLKIYVVLYVHKKEKCDKTKKGELKNSPFDSGR